MTHTLNRTTSTLLRAKLIQQQADLQAVVTDLIFKKSRSTKICFALVGHPRFIGNKAALITKRTAPYGTIRYKLSQSEVGKEFKLKA